ncbi:nicotinate-nucleotide adenylyltransferase [Jeotgalibaca ciconiae]|uniref:Probable nicotinate-nucleotide adenylyltransferase n=1 Tax=Jeotgalibaca ciconiae TaxID=2496265 RepID=A0A3S9HCJ8_9LACT|nr:nicotinate-nucleotide adenylyltransferase [Jeotgalibaca ciconiae]AZP05074.1 nicotinate-nucleotide adenylyltransferase [Jeotgalibaca ciconiae]HJB23963.1 nicotinate-nucleotide adenylyltransferase [Candidatus Jeotgalibaca pullicola]
MVKLFDVQFLTDIIVVEETKPEEMISGRKRVGIIGGTFNPPHLGHLIIAQQVGQQLALDKVYFMPDAEPPHVDEKPFIEGEHRAQMVKRSIEGNDLFEIETIELERGGKSYTIDTMKQLIEENPDTDYYFIIGGDMVEYLPKWERIDELVSLVHFVGVVRPGYPNHSPYPIIWVDAPKIDISSTKIRSMVKSGRSLRYIVPESVEQYIKEEGLYLDE